MRLALQGGGMPILGLVVRVHRVDQLGRRERDAGWEVRV